MENASKALIIAGAILLSILIIGLGMLIFNQAKDAMSNTGMDKQKVDAYNSEFEAYVGNNVNGTKVRSLIDTVRSHNVANQNDETLFIIVTGNAVTGENATAKEDPKTASEANSNLASFKAGIKAGKNYSISVDYSNTTGFINKITINNANSSSNP